MFNCSVYKSIRPNQTKSSVMLGQTHAALVTNLTECSAHIVNQSNSGMPNLRGNLFRLNPPPEAHVKPKEDGSSLTRGSGSCRSLRLVERVRSVCQGIFLVNISIDGQWHEVGSTMSFNWKHRAI